MRHEDLPFIEYGGVTIQNGNFVQKKPQIYIFYI
jgi:hypothetical protein